MVVLQLFDWFTKPQLTVHQHALTRKTIPRRQTQNDYEVDVSSVKPKINMAEKLVDVIVKLRRRGKKDQPPKLYVVSLLIFFSD